MSLISNFYSPSDLLARGLFDIFSKLFFLTWILTVSTTVYQGQKFLISPGGFFSLGVDFWNLRLTSLQNRFYKKIFNNINIVTGGLFIKKNI